MQPNALYPRKPSKTLNIHLYLAANADEQMKSHLREVLQILAILDLTECDPEKSPDIVITDMHSVFTVLQDDLLMSTIGGNVWVITGGKLPELMAGSPSLKMRRIDFGYVGCTVLGQLTQLVTLYDQDFTDATRIHPVVPVSGEFATAA